MHKLLILLILALGPCNLLHGQEFAAPLLANAILQHAKQPLVKKTRGIALPFFDDFAQSSVYPKAQLWENKNVFINNTYGISPPSAGVATFDGLNAIGQVYHPSGFPTKFAADSLTSVGIDLGTLVPSDSVYLSFFYQPEGNGFEPELTDSLRLYFLGNNNTWVRVWAMNGKNVQPFEQVLIPISSSFFLHNNFKFQFVNTASPNSNDDVWNIDYVKVDKNRFWNDVDLKDIALVQSPNSLLLNYTAKPLNHFSIADLETFCGTSIINNTKFSANTRVQFKATNITTSNVLKRDSIDLTLPPAADISVIIPSYNPNIVGTSKQQIQHQFYIPSSGSLTNDTVSSITTFDNYFAYDDGSAEKSYYLFGLTGTPMSTALKFELSVADSVQGLAIKFGGQTPSAAAQPFSIILYKSIDSNTATQQVIYSQLYNTVNYEDSINHFSYYKLDTAQYLSAGIYYVGTTQQPFAGADTLYFGLDANTNSNINNLYYNIDSRWQKSALPGSIMMRPIVGNANSFVPTALDNNSSKSVLAVYPNPTQHRINTSIKFGNYVITDLFGKVIMQGLLTDGSILTASLPNGLYLLKIENDNKIYNTKFIKQ